MEHIVTVEKIIAGGLGLTRLEDGRVMMLPQVLAGERVRVRETVTRRGYSLGRVEEILLPAPDRCRPCCKYFVDCGGCDLQHAGYGLQLAIKQAIVREAMQRAGVELPPDQPEALLASPEQWNYRDRLRLKLGQGGKLGFYRKKSNELVRINHCRLAADRINQALTGLDNAEFLAQLARQVREIEFMLSPSGRELVLVLSLSGRAQPDAALVEQLVNCTMADAVGLVDKHRYRQLLPAEPCLLQREFVLPGTRRYGLSWSGGCFSQVNGAQNLQLINLVCSMAGKLRGRSVLDLYCGMGNFSIPLALQGAAVTGIEWSRESIRWARDNGEAAGVRARFFSSDVTRALEELAADGQHADIIVLDPPRRGLGRATVLLPELTPERIIYVSCDPATLARDLAVLCAAGYHLRRLVPVDMFPQTHHIESVALLHRI